MNNILGVNDSYIYSIIIIMTYYYLAYVFVGNVDDVGEFIEWLFSPLLIVLTILFVLVICFIETKKYLKKEKLKKKK